MVLYLQYRSLCPWALPKCKPHETEKLNDSNSTAKHACALCSCCPASVLVLNAEESADLPGHLKQASKVKVWSERIVSCSVQGVQEQESAVFPTVLHSECRVSGFMQDTFVHSTAEFLLNFFM